MKDELKKFPVDDQLKREIIGMIEDGSNYWNRTDLGTIWESVESQLVGRPFSDLGGVRNIVWNALGIEWTVTFRNQHEDTAAAESIISSLQILAADIADVDLVIAPTKVKLSLNLQNIQKLTMVAV